MSLNKTSPAMRIPCPGIQSIVFSSVSPWIFLRTSIFESLKFYKVAVEFFDSNSVRGCTCAQDFFPFIYFLLIDDVDSIDYRRSGNDSHSRICLLKNLQTKKVIGMRMGNVDSGQRLLSFFDLLQYFFSTGFC